jgi:hypothetical protein
MRKPIPAYKPQKSALSAMLDSTGPSTNPFAEMYAGISGRGEGASSMTVLVFFPHADNRDKAMELNVKKDATMEEVVGFALWTYWEERWAPGLEEGLGGKEDPRRETRLSAVGWIMRIAEEDGEVDDEWPGLCFVFVVEGTKSGCSS